MSVQIHLLAAMLGGIPGVRATSRLSTVAARGRGLGDPSVGL